VGRLQPFFPQLLYVAVGQTEQPLPALSARVGSAAHWKIAVTIPRGTFISTVAFQGLDLGFYKRIFAQRIEK
jgi:hypothetical protein